MSYDYGKLPARCFGSKYLARARLSALSDTLGDDHPATLAARGRWLALATKSVPQRDSTTPEAIAWHRASGADPGYMNRRARRHFSEMQAAVPAFDLSDVELAA